MAEKSNKESFILSATEKHGKIYDYSKVNYVNNRVKVCIVCPEHGEFWQDPHNHLKGKGCPICAKSKTKHKKYTTREFISAANKIHSGKYDYSKTEYVDMNTKVCIICPLHGEFWQTPYLHLNGSGCGKCSHEKNGLGKRLTNDEFIEKSILVHGLKYDYSKTEYTTAKRKVTIICPEHGEFQQTPDKHLQGCGCPKCVVPFSKQEKEISDFVKTIVGENNVIENDRTILDGKELDIFVPSKNIAIEYNGLYWHTRNKNYHLEKTMECEQRGIKLIQIFEDEYSANKKIVLSKISHILKSETLPKIMGRKCEIKVVDYHTAKKFLNENHIQGAAVSTIYLGCYYENALIAIMSFKKDKYGWELTRFASSSNVICQGVGGKMFHYFTEHYNPNCVKSFADRRWTINEDNLYTKLGFVKTQYTPPDYRYYRPQDGAVRHHKFGFRKQILHKKYGFPLTMTETEMTEKLGYKKIYDCGLIKYEWKKRES